MELSSHSGPVEVVVDGCNLSINDVVLVARMPGAFHVTLSRKSEQLMNQSVELKEKVIEDGLPIYGVTSGFGDSSTRKVHDDKAEDLQSNLIKFLSCGIGPVADADPIRATMIIRANCLARGYSGIRPEVVQLLLECLNCEILPLIPERGSVGASGDLVPLSYVAALLTGIGDVLEKGERADARAALARADLEPAVLRPKEGLALVNGTSFMSGFAALAIHDASELAFAADLCTALASRTLKGNPDHFDSFIFDQKPHIGTRRSADTIRVLLDDMNNDAMLLQKSRVGVVDSVYRDLEDPLQDKYSIRCAPHVIGVLHETIDWAEGLIEVEMNSCNDNPLFDTSAGMVRSGGNFYGGHVGQAMDSLKTAVASVGDLLDRQLELIVDEKFNNGLTPNLIPRFEHGSWNMGLHHGFKGMQLVASSLTAEALKSTMPATVFSRSTECHNQDKVSMANIAARDARTVVELVQQVCAIHLLGLAQAADLRCPGGGTLSRPLKSCYDLIRSVSPMLEYDRPLDEDIQLVAELVASGDIRRAVEAALEH
ncbi:aromatic amino acid lyase [Streptomyces flavofungini]|uniref:Aromatic amino acid lyase n=2 Tax=Streptomyces flavofungini TaxID=68200 RepID=A0ABS0XBP7_9ACTN|nr:aromatic amino acid lyase [Streptomyces flavofungini]